MRQGSFFTRPLPVLTSSGLRRAARIVFHATIHYATDSAQTIHDLTDTDEDPTRRESDRNVFAGTDIDRTTLVLTSSGLRYAAFAAIHIERTTPCGKERFCRY